MARWYCRDARRTFSLLPDCLASGLPGSLDELEGVVVKVEESSSVEAATLILRPHIELRGAVRWVRRRVRGVRAALLALVTVMPGRLGSVAEVRAVRATLSSERALVLLRQIGSDYLATLPRPLGFGRGPVRGSDRERRFQHKTGADPPGAVGVLPLLPGRTGQRGGKGNG